MPTSDDAVPGGSGAVVVDIGGDIGAAIVYTPDNLVGLEMEIRRASDDWQGHHTSIRARKIGNLACTAAMFASLPAGSYQVRIPHTDPQPTHTFDVIGSQVAETTWEPIATRTQP